MSHEENKKESAYLAFRLPQELKEFLDKFSEDTDRSISSVLRMAVKEFKNNRGEENEKTEN